MARPSPSWQDANQRYRGAVVRCLAHRIGQRRTPGEHEAPDAEANREVSDAVWALPAPSALDRPEVNFGLTAFEREPEKD